MIVVLSVDQMRFDYLSRFAYLYEGGLARLAAEGAAFTEAHHDHFYTSTAAGHATIATGVYPSRSGIVSNAWWDRTVGVDVYAVEDTLSPVLGRPDLPGVSPANMLRDAVGDWLKGRSPASKVHSVTLKDRSAITMGGRQPDGVYWYDTGTGRFTTSTYYRDSLPPWITEFNDMALVDSYFHEAWTHLLPESAYTASREDSFPAEDEDVWSVFPHRIDVFVDTTAERVWGDSTLTPRYPALYYDELKRTPFADELAFAFVERMIEAEEIGKDDVTDLLFVGASAADYIGHRYGPYSQEIQDYYLRLDRMLEGFLEFLDETVGEQSYVVILTADHGVALLPEEALRRGLDAQRIGRAERQEIIIPPLQLALGELNLVERLQGVRASPYGLTLRFEDDVSEGTRVKARRAAAERLRESPYVADAFAYDDVREHGDDPYREMLLRSFHPNRAPDIVIRYKENYVYRMEVGGTTHETPYRYDTHVPLVFWGPGIAAGTYDRPVRSVDIAPTVAALAGIVPPDDLDGVILKEVAR